MAINLSRNVQNILTSVRWKLRQPDRQNGLVQEPEIIEAIRGAVHSMGPRLLLPAVWVTGLVTITAGSEDTTLPTTASTLPLEYDTVWWLRLTSNGDLLEKVRVEELERFRREGQVAPRSRAVPTEFAMWEAEDGTMNVRFNCVPSKNDTADLYRSVTPQDIETPNDTVPYSRLGLEAIACKVAADLIERIPARMWESCRLDPKAAAAQYRRECDEIVRDERLRRFAHDALGKVQRHVP